MAFFLRFCPGGLSTHVAESPGEQALLKHRTGPFVKFLTDQGVYNEGAITQSWEAFLTPSPWPRTDRWENNLIIHGNYLPPDFPFRSHQSVVYCPRTHAAFGHPRHPVAEFLARGVRVCVGTDSLASNPDLDVLAEIRFLRNRRPDLPGSTLLSMATRAGAEALGWADEAGSLEAGKSADFVAVPLADRDATDPFDLLLAPDAPVSGRRTLFRGEWR